MGFGGPSNTTAAAPRRPQGRPQQRPRQKPKGKSKGQGGKMNVLDDAVTKEPASAPVSPDAVSGSSYNPFRTPFQQFRMSPYLLSATSRTAGRPSLVRSRS